MRAGIPAEASRRCYRIGKSSQTAALARDRPQPRISEGALRLVWHRLILRQRAKSRNLAQRGTCLIAPPHFFQNIREQNVLARFIWLARDGTALGAEGFVEPVLADSHRSEEVQGFGVMNIEPAGMTQRCFSTNGVALLRI